MKYNIVTIPDIHWGCIDPILQVKYMEFVLTFIKESVSNEIPIDLLVIAGDYFDSKLPLNSKEAILAIQWFNELFDLCMECGVKKVRMFQGTMEHDNDQLDVFVPLTNTILEYDKDYFKIFKNTTLEETLPELTCLYCPDETIETSEYEMLYLNELLTMKDIGFFHGSFDVVFGELLERKPDLIKKKNVIFNYDIFNKTTYGPMIAGHWHDGKIYDNLIYCGSPFRYKFNEDEVKGLSFIQYDTDTHEYMYERIYNPLCARYETIEIYTNMYNSKEQYVDVVNMIEKKLNELLENTLVDNKLRIMVFVMDDKSENDVFLSSIRQKFVGNNHIKLTIKNKLKDKVKKEQQKKHVEKQQKYDFIYNKNKLPSEIIHDFIVANNEGYDVPIDYIQKKISQYIS